MSALLDPPRAPSRPGKVLAVRTGPGANCSSLGSAVDALLLGTTAVAALLAAAAVVREKANDEATESADAAQQSEDSDEAPHP